MKRTLAIISIITMHLCVASGQDLSWTFQWDADRYGLIFENTNLVASVKDAICGDLELVLSHIPKNETENCMFVPSNAYYGKYVGYTSLRSGAGMKPFPLGVYSVLGGTNYYHMNEEKCVAYLTGIALTNQYREAVAMVSGWMAMVASAATNTMSCAEYVDCVWFGDLGRVATTNDLSPRDYVDGIADWQACPVTPPVSVLDFGQISKNGNTQLVWGVKHYNPMSKNIVIAPAIHVEGKWRYIGSK